MRFKGIIQKGIGEGAMYVDAYNETFENILKQRFFPGTLNVRTDDLIRLERGITIPSPKPGLHEVHCYPVTINSSVQGFVVVPMVRGHPENVVELLAPVNLRKHFRMKDGDEITCELE